MATKVGGACDAVITGETAEAMGAASKQHVMQMLQAGDAAHKQAMDAMLQLSQADQEKMVRRICGRLCCVAGCLNSGAGPGWRRPAGLRQSAVAAVRVVWA